MGKERYTLLFLPQGSGKVRSITLPAFLVKYSLPLLLLLLLALVWMSYDYVRIKSGYQEIYALKKENVDQRVALQSLAGKISDLEDELIRLKTFGRKLRIMADLGDGKEGKEFLGIGGASEREDLSLNTEDSKALIKGLEKRISLIRDEIEEEKRSFDELHGYLLSQKTRLASIPSIRPAKGWIASSFGYRISPFTGRKHFHRGLDISNMSGTPVVAPGDGIVEKAGRDRLLGKYIVINHGYGIVTKYGHLSKILVKKGQRVKRGQEIGRMGNTGRSTGPHLHYEVVVKGHHVNPLRYILD